MYKGKIALETSTPSSSEIRKKLALEEGAMVSIHIADHTIFIRKLPIHRSMQLKMIINQHITERELPDNDIQKIFDDGNWDHFTNEITGEEHI